MTATPNHALRRTAPHLTAAASAPVFPPACSRRAKLYLEDVVLRNIPYQRQSGDTLYALFTKHRECQRMNTN